MRITLTPGTASHEFACHSSACRPPTSGGTGGSKAGSFTEGSRPWGSKAHKGSTTATPAGKAGAVTQGMRKWNTKAHKTTTTPSAMSKILDQQAAARKETIRQQELRQVRLKEYQAAERAKLDRVMGIRPERTVRVKGAGKWSDWQGN